MTRTAWSRARILLVVVAAAAAVALAPGSGVGQTTPDPTTPDATSPDATALQPGEREGESKVGAQSPGQGVTDLNGGLTPSDLAQVLVGPGVTVTSATITGNNLQFGRFTGLGAVGVDSGVGLSSGSIGQVVGPNVSDGLTTAFGTPGDPDLNALVAPVPTFDAAVLTIQFVPAGSQITFDYVFGSDEYNEFVNAAFDDVFGFFVNGQNCATVAGQRVSVNSINNGNPFGTGGPNSGLYRNNDPNDPGPATIDTEMDGLTSLLTCSAIVSPGATSTLKLAIADTADSALDSAVFLRDGSLSSPSFTG
jgi:hypothetical protein